MYSRLTSRLASSDNALSNLRTEVASVGMGKSSSASFPTSPATAATLSRSGRSGTNQVRTNPTSAIPIAARKTVRNEVVNAFT